MATPPPPPPPPVPALVDELVEEVLLCCPPDDPARLVRAALVCKGWRRVVSDPLFRRRFRDRHRAAPMLGFLYYRRPPICFESTTTGTPFRPRLPPPYGDDHPIRWRTVDARHGRVLVFVRPFPAAPGEESLAVWCPVTGYQQRLPMPQFRYGCQWTAALLCAAAGCAHLDCGCGPFLVVFAVTHRSEKHTSVCVYSSESGAWSKPMISVQHSIGTCTDERPSVLVGNAVCFMLQGRRGSSVLKHDLLTRKVSVIGLPPAASEWFTVLTTIAEEGGLGFATTSGSRLVLWSRDTDVGWARSREIELKALLPAEALRISPEVVGFADGAGAVLVRTSGGFFFTVDMKSGCVRKIGKGLSHYHVVPYLNFCYPELGTSSSGAGPKAGPSTAPQIGGAYVLASRP